MGVKFRMGHKMSPKLSMLRVHFSSEKGTGNNSWVSRRLAWLPVLKGGNFGGFLDNMA